MEPASSQLINQNTDYADINRPVQESWFKRHRQIIFILLALLGIPAALVAAFFVINGLTPPAKPPTIITSTPASSGGTNEYIEINSNLLVHGTINGITNLVGTNDAQTLINKSISGLNNTFSDIPTSAITGGAITIIGANGLSGGTVSLGGSITLGLTGAAAAAVSGAGCTNCVLNDTAATIATQTISPTANIPSLSVRQTTAAGPANDIFNVTDSSGATKYLELTSNGNVNINPGAANVLFGKDVAPTVLTLRGGQAVGTDVAGANITFDASNGTGAGGSGDLIFRTASNSGSLVQFDSGSAISNGTSGTTVTVPDTIANNNNRLLFVTVIPGEGPVTSITWNGVALTHLASQARCTVTPFANCRQELWYLLNPASGTHSLTITLDGASNPGLDFFAEAYYNVDASVPIIATTQSGTGNSFSQTTVTDLHQLVFDSVDTPSGISSVGAGQVEDNCRIVNGTAIACAVGTPSNTPNTTTTYNLISSATWSQITVPLTPVPATGPDPLIDRLHISMSGNIGISNSNPSYALDVVGAVNTDTAYRINGININTAGTLSDVAYLDQINTFTNNIHLTGTLDLNAGGSVTSFFIPQKSGASTCASAASEGLLIRNNGGTQVGHLCINGPTSASPNALAFYADSFNATSTDVAENYSDHTNSLSNGDVVTIDSAHSKSVIKSTKAYDPTILGVISTSPGLTLTGIDESGDTDLVHPRPVALSGRVPVKFSSENGSVKSGDYLTAATKPGYAMRATQSGRVLGIALGSESNGKVLVFVNPGYYNPDQPSLDSNGMPINPSSSHDPNFSSVTSSIGTFQTLNIGSASLLADENGNLKINGNLVVNGGVTISHNLALYGSIDAPNGLAINLGHGSSFTINSNGQTPLSVAAGSTTAKNLTTDKLNIAGSSGLATIDSTDSSVTINSNSITSNSQIIISFEGDFSPATHYWIDQKVSGHSFRLNLDQKPDHDITFSWWIIN